MKTAEFQAMEEYAFGCMKDSAHDREHVRRVLYWALELAREEPDVDYSILIAACLLHDIGRDEQFRTGERHNEAGSRMACSWLLERGWPEERAARVRDCILSHSHRGSGKNPPRTVEARLLFDADKLEAVGAMGIARTLLYKGRAGEPLYSLTEEGKVSDGSGEEPPSFLQEYRHKLEGLYGGFTTGRGREIAEKRREAAARFYESLLSEAEEAYQGRAELAVILSRGEK